MLRRPRSAARQPRQGLNAPAKRLLSRPRVHRPSVFQEIDMIELGPVDERRMRLRR